MFCAAAQKMGHFKFLSMEIFKNKFVTCQKPGSCRFNMYQKLVEFCRAMRPYPSLGKNLRVLQFSDSCFNNATAGGTVKS
jgi:hypothetical protein